MEVGDHLVSGRGLYSHHGIYIGQGDVIHYAGLASGLSKGRVEVTSLAWFRQGQTVRVKSYSSESPSRSDIVSRARSKLGEDEYHLLFNNCEHFATWCVLGEKRSAQVENVGRAGAGLGVIGFLARTGSQAPRAPETAQALMLAIRSGSQASAALLGSQVASKATISTVAGMTAGAGFISGAGATGAGATAAFALAGAPVLLPLAVGAVACFAVGFGVHKVLKFWD